MKQRYDTLDIMKGIAMIFVIIDHSGYGLHPIIDHLEVPVFYVISGFLFKSGVSFKKFAVRKFYSLIVPYLFFSLLYTIPYYFTDIRWADSESGAKGILSHAVSILIMPANYPLWFIKALFISLFIYYFIDWIVAAKKLYVELLVNIALAVVITAVSQQSVFSDKLLMSGIPQALQALPLIGFGHCASRLLAQNSSLLSCRNAAVIAAVSIVGALATGIEGVHLHAADLGECSWLFYPCALFSAVAFAAVCRLLVKVTPIKYIGVNSISFFGFHAIALFIILTLIDMPQALLPLAAILLCVPAAELYRRSLGKLRN